MSGTKPDIINRGNVANRRLSLKKLLGGGTIIKNNDPPRVSQSSSFQRHPRAPNRAPQACGFWIVGYDADYHRR